MNVINNFGRFSKTKSYRFTSARQRCLDEFSARSETPPKASEYLRHLKRLLSVNNSLKAVVWCRVSGREQNRRRNLNNQAISLVRKIESRDVAVVKVFKSISSGWDQDRTVFHQAIEYALHHDAVVIAESTDRFIRSTGFTAKTPSVQPSRVEWETLADHARNVTLATLLHPDTNWRKVRGYQSKRGIREKGAKCGRPIKFSGCERRLRRQALLARALELHSWHLSLRDIEKELGVPWRTLGDWLRPFR